MPESCLPADLRANASPLSSLSERDRNVIQTYLLARIAEEPLDIGALLQAAQPFSTLSQSQLLQIQAALLCQLLS